jgi:Xaa-Pro aminopeptidase
MAFVIVLPKHSVPVDHVPRYRSSMIQTFDDVTDPSVGAPRVAALRAVLATHGLDGFVVPRADQHQNEYVPDRWNRLRYLTGFTGSAGAAIVLKSKAAAFTDGRYVQQIAAQVDPSVFRIVSTVETSPEAWLETNLRKKARFGVDPWLHTEDQLKRLRTAVEKAGATLAMVEGNPVDASWPDRPPLPDAPVVIHSEVLAGVGAPAKIEALQDAIKAAGASHAVVFAPEAIAWLLNIRGGDLPHVPVVLSWMIVPVAGRPLLFIEQRKLSTEAARAVALVCDIKPYEILSESLAGIAATGARVLIDPATAPAALGMIVKTAGGEVIGAADPTLLMKARKSPAELSGARAAHQRDGAAMIRFLAWFDTHSAQAGLTEIDVARRLEQFRQETNTLKDLSFPSISGSGPNGAIIHYRVTHATNRVLDQNSLFLIDSGGQYADGTTDITRTLAIGQPTAQMKKRFTLVLEGMIAISRARFPKGTTGGSIDVLARRALWEAGLDFDHGTGHGVGAYLSVHEGPQRIAKVSGVPLEPGMILSNEPGYYEPGRYGIRIENLVVVTEPVVPRGGRRAMMGFETLTLAPIDRRLIIKRLLSPPARAWLDSYHRRVLEEIGPLVDSQTSKWLAAACAPL